MMEDVIKDPRIREKLLSSGFIPILKDFETYLSSRRYAARTVWFYKRGAAHFAFWVARKKINPAEITDRHITSFLSRHLGKCCCPLSGITFPGNIQPALRIFCTVLDVGGYRSLLRDDALTDVDREVLRFDDHLCKVCGLREGSRMALRRHIYQFLSKSFDDGQVVFSRLTPQAVVRYVSRRASHYKPGTSKALTSALRSYFRFLQLHNECDGALVMAIPSVASWRLSSLPRILTDDELNLLFQAFDRKKGIGLRDYAVTRCFTDLGLRANEVCRLRIDDINWRKGFLRIVEAKPRRDDELPLPSLLGTALAAYLRRGRPKTSERQVFVRHFAPVGYGLTRQGVQNIVIRAAARAGLSGAVKGTQILRHTAATRMLRHGASMKEVADVLRHRSIDTSAIYAKVDLPRLSTVAIPWPENLL